MAAPSGCRPWVGTTVLPFQQERKCSAQISKQGSGRQGNVRLASCRQCDQKHIHLQRPPVRCRASPASGASRIDQLRQEGWSGLATSPPGEDSRSVFCASQEPRRSGLGCWQLVRPLGMSPWGCGCRPPSALPARTWHRHSPWEREAQRRVPVDWPSVCFQIEREVKGLLPKATRLTRSQERKAFKVLQTQKL